MLAALSRREHWPLRALSETVRIVYTSGVSAKSVLKSQGDTRLIFNLIRATFRAVARGMKAKSTLLSAGDRLEAARVTQQWCVDVGFGPFPGYPVPMKVRGVEVIAESPESFLMLYVPADDWYQIAEWDEAQQNEDYIEEDEKSRRLLEGKVRDTLRARQRYTDNETKTVKALRGWTEHLQTNDDDEFVREVRQSTSARTRKPTLDDFQKHFDRVISRYLNTRRTSKRQLFRDANITAPPFYNLRRGAGSYDSALKLARVIGCKPEELYFDAHRKSYDPN